MPLKTPLNSPDKSRNLSLRRLTSISFDSSENSVEEASATLQRILNLSNKIFDVSTDHNLQTHHSSLSEWKSRLSSSKDAVIFYSVSTNDNVSEIDDDKLYEPSIENLEAKEVITGFIFAYPRLNDQHDSLAGSTIHIWLAVVGPRFRSEGIFRKLVLEVEHHASYRGYKKLSVATFPEKFGRMVKILRAEGWAETGQEQGGKVVFERKIDITP